MVIPRSGSIGANVANVYEDYEGSVDSCILTATGIGTSLYSLVGNALSAYFGKTIVPTEGSQVTLQEITPYLGLKVPETQEDFVEIAGIKWAKGNIVEDGHGGYKVGDETDYGCYFSWGNTDAHAEGSGYDFSQAVYDETPAASINSSLSLSQDAARANLGTPWRMPTAAEFQALYDACTSVWTSLNGVNGRLFISNADGKALFFPAAGIYNGTSLNDRGSNGFYWSSTYESATYARDFNFISSGVNPQYSSSRRYGFCVRAVQD